MEEILYIELTAEREIKSHNIKKGEKFYLGFDRLDNVEYYNMNKEIILPKEEK